MGEYGKDLSLEGSTAEIYIHTTTTVDLRIYMYILKMLFPPTTDID